MSDATMPDDFTLPDMETLRDDSARWFWLTHALHRISNNVADLAKGQATANHRAAKAEERLAALESARADADKHIDELRTTQTVHTGKFAVLSKILIGMLIAVIGWLVTTIGGFMVRGGFSR